MSEFQNTRQMSMEPISPDSFCMMDGDGSGDIQLLPVMAGEVFQKFVAFPVIVEMWDKKKDGRRHRAWLSTFTQAERNTLGRYYGRFYRWYLVTGTPRRVSCQLKTIELLQRAVVFFAGL